MRALVHDRPWATLLSGTPRGGLVGSHLPVLLDDGPSLSVVGHLGRPDDESHELGEHEVLMIIAGPHGYVPPGWYGGGPAVPAYDYMVAHLYGRPELLDAADTYRVLTDTVDRFEGVRPSPFRVDDDHARKVARGVTGFRLRPTRVVAEVKLRQDEPAAIAKRIIHALETDAGYRNPQLARQMRQVRTSEESR